MVPDKEFNLLHEPWILVIKPDGVTEEISLLNLFEKAHSYRGLAGELPTQDIAVLRLLLAILHAVFARFDLNGEFEPISSPAEALARWKALWDRREFPVPLLHKYLLEFEDRFWLFHPERPFYQVANIGKATEYTAAKLDGALAESGNKLRLFPQRCGDSKKALCFGEAARWLLYINAYDDTASKPSVRGLPSPGAGWLGKLGLITAVGSNLYETLLLNLVLLKDGSDELWGKETPLWEEDEIRTDERVEISMPDNPSGLLSLQSRRLLLKRQNASVTGYLLQGGDFFSKENAFFEQMTMWRNAAKKKDDPPVYHPKRHDPGRQLWRDLAALVGQGGSGRRPGVVSWLARLKSEGMIPSRHFQFQTAAVKYCDKDFFVDDVFGDAISFNADLLTGFGESWISRVLDEVAIADKLAEQAGQLAQNLAIAAGADNGWPLKMHAKEQAYYRMDLPFRRWLESIDPQDVSVGKEELCNLWWEQAKSIVRELGRELVNQTGPQAFAGRIITDEKKKKSYRYTAPEAYNRFLYKTSSREALQASNMNEGRVTHGE